MAVIDTLEKYKGKTWTVELSDGETFYINEDTVFDFSLKKGQAPTEEVVRLYPVFCLLM